MGKPICCELLRHACCHAPHPTIKTRSRKRFSRTSRSTNMGELGRGISHDDISSISIGSFVACGITPSRRPSNSQKIVALQSLEPLLPLSASSRTITAPFGALFINSQMVDSVHGSFFADRTTHDETLIIMAGSPNRVPMEEARKLLPPPLGPIISECVRGGNGMPERMPLVAILAIGMSSLITDCCCGERIIGVDWGLFMAHPGREKIGRATERSFARKHGGLLSSPLMPEDLATLEASKPSRCHQVSEYRRSIDRNDANA